MVKRALNKKITQLSPAGRLVHSGAGLLAIGSTAAGLGTPSKLDLVSFLSHL